MHNRYRIWLVGIGMVVSLPISLAVEATEDPACTSYTTSVTVAKSSGGQKYIEVNVAVPEGEYAKLCFKKSALGEIVLDNTDSTLRVNSTVPLLIDNLTVQQTVTPSQCGVTAATCPSVIIKGTAPIILRNPKVYTATGVNLPLVDGIAIQSDHVTIEVTPDKAGDPAYVTVKNFRTGIVVDQRTGVVLDGVKVTRTAAQVGSVGLRVAGPGNVVTNASTTCTDTGIHALGGSATAPIQITGGTISAGGCATDAGVLLQGDHVYLTDTTITGPQVGVILDPLNGPMGVTGGSITNAAVGIEVRNAPPATLLALSLQPDTFTEVDQLYDFTTAATPTAPTVTWSKTCVKTTTQHIEGVGQEICDTTVIDNTVSAIYGVTASQQCAVGESGKILLYTTGDTKAEALSVCNIGLSGNSICGFSCLQTLSNTILAIPFDTKLKPVLLGQQGAAIMDVVAVDEFQDSKTAVGPLAVMPSPVDIPNVTPGGGSNDGGLDALTGAGGDNVDASDGGTVLGGGGGDGDALQTLDSNTGPLAHEPLAPDADQPAFEETTAQKESGTSAPQVLSGSFGGDGDGGGGMAAPGVGGCSMILQE